MLYINHCVLSEVGQVSIVDVDQLDATTRTTTNTTPRTMSGKALLITTLITTGLVETVPLDGEEEKNLRSRGSQRSIMTTGQYAAVFVY